MTLRHVQRLFRYWGRQLPTHEVLAARYGLTDPGPARDPRLSAGFTEAEIAEIDRLAVRVGLA